MSENKEKNIGQASIIQSPQKGFKFVVKDGSITTRMLADDSITSDKLQAGSVETDNIKDGSVTLNKLSFDIVGSMLSMITKDINNIWEKLSEITGEAFNGLSFDVSPKYFISEEPVPVYISAACGDTKALFEHIAFYINGIQVYEAVGVDSVAFQTEISNTSEIKYVATVLGNEYTGAETVVHYNSYWLGAGQSYQDVMNNEHLIPVTRGMKGSYDIHFNQGDKLFIILGSALRDMFVRADMNGFESPLTEEAISVDDSNYSVLTSENAYVEGMYNIDINS